MKACWLLLATVLCLQADLALSARDRSKPCRPGKNCKIRLNSRLRFLRDLSRSMHKDRDVIGLTLKSLNDYNREGHFGTFDPEASAGYDIPKYVCPRGEDGEDMLPCPSTDNWNRVHCIDYFALCDKRINCPSGEDEDPTMCLFQQASETYMKKMLHTMYRLSQNVHK